MTTPAAWTPVPLFKPSRKVAASQKLLGGGLRLQRLLQLGILLPSLGQRDVQLIGDHLGDAIPFAVTEAEDAADVA